MKEILIFWGIILAIVWFICYMNREELEYFIKTIGEEDEK